MYINKLYKLEYAIFCLAICAGGFYSEVQAQTPKAFKGQGEIQKVSTISKPVNYQKRAVVVLEDGVTFDNRFAGAALYGVRKVAESSYEVTILPENTPINQSPWYAFKVRANAEKKITISLKYPEKIRNRYTPKISNDGKTWSVIDSTEVLTNVADSAKYSFKLKISPQPVWVAAQELFTSTDSDMWLKTFKAGKITTIGKSTLGRDIKVMKIGNLKSRNRILIFGRQHPPEVTGQLAMNAFVEAIMKKGTLSKSFLDSCAVYVVPILNPDGVDEGFWRHNAGGIDLNRDWNDFNQPESKALRDFLKTELDLNKKRLLFAIDFHATHDDIYYTVDPQLKGIYPGLVDTWLAQTKEKIPGYILNVKPLYKGGETYTAFSYLSKTYGAESLVYEIGDQTSRAFIRSKGEISAQLLMELLLKRLKVN